LQLPDTFPGDDSKAIGIMPPTVCKAMGTNGLCPLNTLLLLPH